MSKISGGVLTLALLLASANAAFAQPVSDKFIGAWTLQSWVMTDTGGNETNPYGLGPIGQIVYTDTGRVALHQMNPDAELPDFSSLTPSVALARFAGSFFAYWGTYTIDARAGTVTHHLEGAMDQTYMGTDQVRRFEFVGDDTLLLTAVIDDDLTREAGLSGTNVLTWGASARHEPALAVPVRSGSARPNVPVAPYGGSVVQSTGLRPVR